MDSRLLIDAVVRQTTLLIAQLATSTGIRAPLVHLADQVFLELAQEIEQQGVFRAVCTALIGKLTRGGAGGADSTLIGGSTLSFDLCAEHPFEAEVKGLLARVRRDIFDVWQRVSAYNAEHPPGDEALERVVFYVGQNHIPCAPLNEEEP